MELPLKPTASEFHAGERVGDSGIYLAVHRNHHRVPHRVVLLSTDAFPECPICRDGVHFEQLQSATFIFDDEDFAREN